jgi:hypothetical protein
MELRKLLEKKFDVTLTLGEVEAIVNCGLYVLKHPELRRAVRPKTEGLSYLVRAVNKLDSVVPLDD